MLNEMSKLSKIFDFKILVKNHTDGIKADVIVTVKDHEKSNNFVLTPMSFTGEPNAVYESIRTTLAEFHLRSVNQIQSLGIRLAEQLKKVEKEVANTKSKTSGKPIPKKEEASLFDAKPAVAEVKKVVPPPVQKEMPKTVAEATERIEFKKSVAPPVQAKPNKALDKMFEASEQEPDMFSPSTVDETAKDINVHPQGENTPDWAENLEKAWNPIEPPTEL